MMLRPRIHVRPWPTVASVVLVLVFAALAYWQGRRALAAQAVITGLERASRGVPRPWNAWHPRSDDWRRWRYHRVIVRGTYDPGHQVLLEEMYNDGESGYDVLTPLHRKEGGWVLVDRGWIPRGFMTRSPPRLSPPAGVVTVIGILERLPRAGIRLGPNPPTRRWPARLLFPRRRTLEERLGISLPSAIILLGPHQPGGYVRDWGPPTRLGPWRHWGYAAQWALLAVVVIVVWMFFAFKHEDEHGTQES